MASSSKTIHEESDHEDKVMNKTDKTKPSEAVGNHWQRQTRAEAQMATYGPSIISRLPARSDSKS